MYLSPINFPSGEKLKPAIQRKRDVCRHVKKNEMNQGAGYHFLEGEFNDPFHPYILTSIVCSVSGKVFVSFIQESQELPQHLRSTYKRTCFKMPKTINL